MTFIILLQNQSSNNSLGNSNPFGQANQQPADNSTTPVFGSQTSGTPAFGSQSSKPPPAYGSQSTNPPAFGSQSGSTPAFGSQPASSNPATGGFNFKVGEATFNFAGNTASTGGSFQFR